LKNKYHQHSQTRNRRYQKIKVHDKHKISFLSFAQCIYCYRFRVFQPTQNSFHRQSQM